MNIQTYSDCLILPLTGTNFHGPKLVGTIEVLLCITKQNSASNSSKFLIRID